jgi:endonuclease/exonuclease/phosphatase family metal-dependent hydrolase
MPYYKPLKNIQLKERVHIIENLQKLRLKLKSELPDRSNRSTLLLSTWNLRKFADSENRLEESYWYIAEIISFFDLIAVQEIGNDMSALLKLMTILGYKFDYIVTDTPNAEGGGERIAFIYNTGKVKFKNIAGEVYLDTQERKEYNLDQGFARPPFVVAFQASWFKFNLCSVHIYYGTETKNETTGEKDKTRRVKEIKAIATKLSNRAKKEDVTYIVLGDFNIESVGDEYYKALVGDDKNKTGFYIHPLKDKIYTNSNKTRAFDQIAFNMNNVSLTDIDINEENKEVKIGIINYYDAVFNDAVYYKQIAKDNYKKENKPMPKNWKLESWRTFHMSDHFPLWIELKIDFTDQYLETLKTKGDTVTNSKTEIPK